MEIEAGLDDRERFAAEVRSATRSTAISAGAIAFVGFPVWIGFDYLIDADTGGDVLAYRLLGTLILGVLLALVVFTRLGHRYPGILISAIILTVNAGITLMIVEVHSDYAAYALGLSLTMYASGFLLIWSPAYMAALCGLSILEITLILLVSDPIPTDAVATVYFYFVTACVLAFLGQLHRHRAAWREFESRTALEREQGRSAELVRELDRQSREDSLTGLANRRAWDEALVRECARAQRTGGGFCVLLCDIDQLKPINDSLGHPVGDAVLRTVADRLRGRARSTDLIARVGGDEFAVLSPGADLSGGSRLAEDLRQLVEVESTAAGPGRVTISVGVADWVGLDDNLETLMSRADRNLYTAKSRRNVVCADEQPAAL